MHSGWGALVAVSVSDGAIAVIERRRVAIADPGMRGAIQPYHFAEKLKYSEAEEHLKACAAASERLARNELRDVVQRMEGHEYRIEGCGLLMASGRALPSLPEILASHPLIHTAEGEFFRNAVRRACDRLGILVSGYRQHDLSALAESVFGSAAPRIQQSIANLGRMLGPPWTSDQKAATLVACLVLAEPGEGAVRKRRR
jgi:hypothetical protein